ncbi:hypothetical protein [Sodalis sp.]|uniref:hypothetical protein n=1 Tax=Sodalis sp. (in: enterobacteria) TaxID=1898979 RepID=UPI003873348E
MQIRYRSAHRSRGTIVLSRSFRQHNAFHDQCVERILLRSDAICHQDALSVYVRYTRRSELNVNLWRSNTHFRQPGSLHGNNALRHAITPLPAVMAVKLPYRPYYLARTGLTGIGSLCQGLCAAGSPAPGQNWILILLYIPA